MKPRVLLLGDSIRLSYQPGVTARLADRAQVTGPADNGRFALYTLARLGAWLEECGRPDVVHWNNGLWDLGRHPDRRPEQIPVEDYVGNLSFILARLRATGAVVIWRNTTPVRPDRGWRDQWLFEPDAIARYNDAAQRLMEREGVPCHDLHGLVRARADDFLDTDGVHLNPAGREACAAATVEFLEPWLGSLASRPSPEPDRA